MDHGSLLDNSPIIETNNDACQCKFYAIQRGYWRDPYLKYFLSSTSQERRTPEISLGYYVRVHGLRQLIDKFLRLTSGQCQILNLGCGYDTTIFYLLDQSELSFEHFVDLDFPEITEMKSNKIRRIPPLRERLPAEEKSWKIPSGFHSSRYTILPVDLRDRSELNAQLQLLIDRRILDVRRATLIINECVLIYMSDEHSLDLLNYFSSKFSSASLVLNFEQINMNDRFGEIMLQNLKQRSCHLIGLNACQSKESQLERYRRANFTSMQCVTLNEFYHRYLDRKEKERIEAIDGGLDEKELLEQLFEHYCFSWASRDERNLGLGQIHFQSNITQ